MTALNTEIENATRMTLNTDTEKWWLWTPKLRSDDDGSERQAENTMMALKAETKKWWWLWTAKTENMIMMAPNAETENAGGWLWTPILRSDDDDSERQAENTMMALKAETKKWWWLWTPKIENVIMMAPNTETENAARMALNTDIEKWWWWLWTSGRKHDDGSESRN